MAVNKSNIRYEILQELNKEGIEEFRFRVFDQNDAIILSSSTRYYQSEDAMRELEDTAENIRNNPKAFQIKQSKNRKWYFNIVNPKGEIIARRIEYYDSQEALIAETERVKQLFVENPLDVRQAAPPCQRDEKLCTLYEQIQILVNDCFPDNIPDMKGEFFCAQDILQLIRDFHQQCPEYNLVEVLSFQIAVMEDFIRRPDPNTFPEAQGAANGILNYLFTTGQCDCEPDFGISENASIQSSHLYLQAAGSLGLESTKGIHLRWMLKGALANHLPKADYAVPGINFNKNDDYVRIYRSPYIQSSKVLNFEQQATTINNSDATWMYTVSGEAFYVYFLNTTKYAQVLSAIDPASNPIDFIKAYGNEVIEVEHKTELSFSITPFIQPTLASSITKIELLSVDANLISAPKVASLRKKYTTSAINGQKLFSENIRSVRLQVADGVLTTLHFEFYRDFIAEANRKQSWTYLGQYALTKDTPTAHQRLEPGTNVVNGKWERFNDSAYVNVNNYKEKWNGATVDPENRILNTVDTYITLSDDPTNPQAIETFLVNDLSVSPDPDYNPSDEEAELSNLYVLQLASLDFHIARMLGLGTLDLDQAVFEGQYMYLAEYITLGDLQDGLGAQEVQHLYCSLPTGLSDQRLPLPVDLKEIVPGIIQGVDTEAPTIITDPNGYAFDGKTRFLSLFNEDLPEELENQFFYYTNYEFISAEQTISVYSGLEYRRTSDPDWRKPELPFDGKYLNIDSTVPNDQKNETLPIIIPEPSFPLFVHREKDNGWHDYSSYGINWFSRATRSSVIKSIQTVITPANSLQPPTNLNAVLIRPESPLLLTSANEQTELAGLTAADKTFIRLTFEYNHSQDMISYHRTIDGEVVSGYAELPDNDELFGDDFEVYFRNRVPIAVSGKAIVSSHSNPILATIQTEEYELYSSGSTGGVPDEVITPSLIGNGDNFIGSPLTIEGANYIIHQVDNSGTYPEFTVFKNDADGFPVELGSTIAPSELTMPASDKLFLVVENMLTTDNWSLPDPAVSTSLPAPLPNPLPFKVDIDQTTVHREEITITTTDGTVETHVQKFRGVYEDALIAEYPNPNEGLYKITFPGFNLVQHSQSGPGPRVEWFNGVVRIHSQGDPNGPRRELKVIRTENIGTANALIVYAADLSFDPAPSYDRIQVGNHKVNYYPGYKLYLFHDPTHNLDEPTILPATDEGVRYSIFGLRTHDNNLGYFSKISQPVLMYAQEIVEPQPPRLPAGSLFATRPDFYGKASYTFTTIFEHKPHAVQFNRASDIQMLSAIYKVDDLTGPTDYNVESIMRDIFLDRKSIWMTDRWNNLLSWNYTADGGLFEQLPADPSGVRLPLPNNPNFIASINTFIDGHNAFYGQSVPYVSSITSLHQLVIPAGPGHGSLELVDFMRDIIFNCFVPLTEIPIIYKHIKGGLYKPIPKKQVIRDRNGELLNPTDPDFDMAPMAKITGTGSPNHEVQFTDFGLDGASNAKYFYAVREFNLQMKTGPYSPVLGPISMVNTAPPSAPEIVKVTPILENIPAGVPAAIEVKINSYPVQENIKKINIYRATAAVDALSIRTMDMVSEMATDLLLNDPTWVLKDEFNDLGYVPYGDPLFYKVVVQREVKYKENGVEVTRYAPSEASKMTITNIVENSSPPAPDLEYYSTQPNASYELDMVTLSWNKTVHNGTYQIQKTNSNGNWETIKEFQSNDLVVQVQLLDTDLASNILLIADANGKQIYHRFRIVAKNFAGMISQEEKAITIYDQATWKDIASI
ncbi:MAG: hypothetical protein AAGG75_21230 [Bacteroidota bacterium]